MTHTLHRMGSVESLREDYVVLVMPSKDINHEVSGPKLRRFLEMALKAGAIKIGDARLGNQYHQGGIDKLLKNVEDRAVVHAVFKDRASLIKILRDLKEADLGIAVVFSGLFEKVHELCEDVGTGPHTVNMSAESFGRVDLLPEPRILEITTMCGHHMVSPYLVKHLIKEVKRGRITSEDASVEMAKQCTCNFFNVERGIKLIEAYSESK